MSLAQEYDCKCMEIKGYIQAIAYSHTDNNCPDWVLSMKSLISEQYIKGYYCNLHTKANLICL